jgi:CubicO group peptidase (beta-lactamase class C family)
MTRTITTLSLCAAAAIALGSAAGAQTAPATAPLPDTALGRHAAAYLAAFNAPGDEALQSFLLEHFDPAALRQRPIENRLAAVRPFRQAVRTLTAHSVLAESPGRLEVLAQGGNGHWLAMSFEAPPAPPHLLLAIRIDESLSPTELAAAPKNEAALAATLDRSLGALTANDEFAGALLIQRKGATLYQKAFGLASREHGVPNTVETRFNLGSINKLFTRVAVAQLVEKGLLAPTDTLGTLLPDYSNRDAAAKVTLEQLLDMTSGIGDFFGPRFDETPKDRLRSIRDYLPLFASDPLLFEPGTQNRYSNGGYVVLGAVIEKVTGQDYYTYVREHIFEPAGMTASESFEADQIAPNIASGYTRGDGGTPGSLRNNIYTRPARGSSAGGGYSTVGDLARFVAALRGGKLLKPETLARFFPSLADPKAGGLGFAGGAPGISAAVETDTADDTLVVVLTNLDPPCAPDVARRVHGWLRAMRVPSS